MIRLPHGYNGRLVNNQSVPPGDYHEDDPRLCGIADYLVANGFATRLSEPEIVEPENETDETPDVVTKQIDIRNPPTPRKTEKPKRK